LDRKYFHRILPTHAHILTEIGESVGIDTFLSESWGGIIIALRGGQYNSGKRVTMLLERSSKY